MVNKIPTTLPDLPNFLARGYKQLPFQDGFLQDKPCRGNLRPTFSQIKKPQLLLDLALDENDQSSFHTKKHKPTLAVVNVEIALLEMKTAQVEVEAQNSNLELVDSKQQK